MLLDDHPIRMKGDKVEARRVLFVKVHFLFIGPIVELAKGAAYTDVGNAVLVDMGPSMNMTEENAPETLSCRQQCFMQFSAIKHAHVSRIPPGIQIEGRVMNKNSQ